MKTPHLRPLVLPLVLLLAACAARPEDPVHTTLFRPGDHGSKYYRIPALATTAEGTLLAVADRRNDSQGDLPNAIDLVVRRSTDNGRTWSDQIPIALQLADGTLLFAAAAHRTGTKWPPLYNYVCLSGDGGRTWRLLPAAASDCGDEAKLAELADGGWLMSIRNPDKGCRRFAVSHDRGATWSPVGTWSDLPDPACNGDLLRYSLRSEGASRDRLLHSIPADTAERRNVSVALSYDEGRTWPVRKTVWEGPAGYSSLTRLADGGIGLLTEVGDWDSGFEIRFTRLSIDWLTDGADNGR